jgi:hypothetical protein
MDFVKNFNRIMGMEGGELDGQFSERNNSKIWPLEGGNLGLKKKASEWGLDSKSFLKIDLRIPKGATIGIAEMSNRRIGLGKYEKIQRRASRVSGVKMVGPGESATDRSGMSDYIKNNLIDIDLKGLTGRGESSGQDCESRGKVSSMAKLKS